LIIALMPQRKQAGEFCKYGQFLHFYLQASLR
jgi:hypothetical protein